MKLTRKQLRNIIKESILVEAPMLKIMSNPYEDLSVFNSIANYALSSDIEGALADPEVNSENLDLDLDDMKGWVHYVGKDGRHFSEDVVVPENWDLDAVYDFMEDLESAWMNQRGQDMDASHQSAPDVEEREAIGAAFTNSYVLPAEIKSITFQVRRRGGQPSNVNVENRDAIGNISAQSAAQYGTSLDDIIAVLRDGGAKERKKQKPIKHTPPMYD